MRKTFALLLVMLLILSGCGKQTKDSAKTDSNTAASEEDTNKAERTDEESNEESNEESGEEGEEYRDIVYDRTLTEGKMAVYYIAPVTSFDTWTGSSHAGDSILYITPDGKTLLYDCNTAVNSATVVNLLQSLGIEQLDYFVNSHPHNDHCGGYKVLLKHITVGHVYTPPGEPQYTGKKGDTGSRGLIEDCDELGISHSYLQAGDSFRLGEYVTIKIYNPPSDYDYTDTNINVNEMSLLMKVLYKDSSFMNSADLGNNLEELGRASISEILNEYGSELKADVMSMVHHADSAQMKIPNEWFDTINAKIYIGSMNAVNDAAEYFKYVKTGAHALHTAIDGTIVVTTSGDGTYDVQTEYDRYTNYYGTLDTKDGHMRVE